MKPFIYGDQEYYVSTDGLVYKNDILLSQYDNGSGYKTVILSGKPHYVHKLLAILYVPNPGKKLLVYHKNGIIDDNRADNVVWRSSSEIRHIDIILPKEKKNGRGHLKAVKKIDPTTGEVIQIFDSLILAAKAMNVHSKSIWSAINKPHLCKGFKWIYA